MKVTDPLRTLTPRAMMWQARLAVVTTLVSFLVFYHLPAPAGAADGDLDPSFGAGGKVTTDFSGFSNRANAVAVQSDGKIVAAGSSAGNFALTRYNTDGSLDFTFDTDGKVLTDFFGFDDIANAVAIQADGKIVAAGSATGASGNTDFALARYQAQSVAAADLAIFKNFTSPEPLTAGSNFTYTIDLTNNGPAAAESVVVTDDLPDAITFVSCAATAGGVCSGAGNDRTVNFTSLAPGASATITLVAKVKCSVADGTLLTNTATVTSATLDPEPSNNTTSVSVTVLNPPELITLQDDSSGDVLRFNTLTGDYTLTSCAGQRQSGRGTIIRSGCAVQLLHIRSSRTVTAFADVCRNRGDARVLSQSRLLLISDEDITDNSCACQ